MKLFAIVFCTSALFACGHTARNSPTTPAPIVATSSTTIPRVIASSENPTAIRRNQAIALLEAYTQRADYPRDRSGIPLAVFRDDDGRRCPMSELIFATGRGDLVDQVVATNNMLRLADVTHGDLQSWMTHSGLTRDEIIRVQGVMAFEPSVILEPTPESIAIAFATITERLLAELATLKRDTSASLALLAAN